MKKFFVLALVVMVALSACGAPAPATAPAAVPPTAVSLTEIPPTATPEPVDPVITALMTDAEKFKGEGRIASTEGEQIRFNDLENAMAQLNYYDTYLLGDPSSIGNFVYTGHFKWTTATETSDKSGCGIVFGTDSKGDQYAMFVDKARIYFFVTKNGNGSEVGKTSGTGKLNISGPAFEADVNLIVNGGKAYVYVNGDFIGEYTLIKDTAGQFGHALISGTNKDYGTRCSVTDAALLMLK